MDSFEKWLLRQKEKLAPQYAHFDYRVTLEQCLPYITDPDKVARHGFYPFIHYSIKSRRIKDGKKAEPKVRSVYYSAHLDGWIYKYYSYLLNEFYNARVKVDGIDAVAIAYRTDLKKSNIDFAYEALHLIKNSSQCYVMVGDFTDFFDSLEHNYLKERLCDLLEVSRLPDDFYAVFKNVTKFSYFELSDLIELNGLGNNKKGRRALNKKAKVLSTTAFRSEKNRIKSNPGEGVGVPQGSPISAVLANIYMLVVDKAINDFVRSFGGLYRRYSDDFIIVLPESFQTSFQEQYFHITGELKSIPGLTLQGKKTKLFHVKEGLIENCTKQFIEEAEDGTNRIDFLGFSYNGEVITIRDKTISKYYNRMYGKIRGIVKRKGFSKTGKRISYKKLYEKYSYKGSLFYYRSNKTLKDVNIVEKPNGNFLDYVSRAQTTFKDEPIDRGTKNHMQKIRRRLK